MFQRMEISENIYEGLVKTSYQKKTTILYSNCTGVIGKLRGGSALTNNSSKMSVQIVMHKQMCVDCPEEILYLTCIIHCNDSHSSYKFKVLNDFVTRCDARCLLERVKTNPLSIKLLLKKLIIWWSTQ